MPLAINIDRFTRLKQVVSGKIVPQELPRLAEFLAGSAGEITYSLSGCLVVDPVGSQERHVKCIIYGWFLLSDPVTLSAIRHTLDISSSLILVKDESGLPPLEMESENIDYVVCGPEMDVLDRVEEEILLSLPAQAVNRREMLASQVENTRGEVAMAEKTAKMPQADAAVGKKISPFAKLAELKKSNEV